MKAISGLATLLLFFMVNGFAADAVPDESPVTLITFGIVPQQSATKLARLWAPILGYISKEAGLTVVFRTARDIPTFEQRLRNGEYDLAYMNPYHYTVFHEDPGYQAFAKARDKKIKGILVSSKDGDINKISQLEGSTLAFPAPASFAASILTRAYLQKQGVSFTPRYVSSHDSVYRTVAAGLYPAGGGVIRTLRNMDVSIGEKLKILWESPGYTPHAFAAHPGLAPAKLGMIQKAMIEMEHTEAGQKLLKSIQLKGIEAAGDSDWDDVRALDIRQLFEK
jgi:phosphonate transport system substrate-binding protein